MAKQIMYMAPVEWMSGNISGRQSLYYDENQGRGYSVPVGDSAEALNYQARIVAQVSLRRGRQWFQVRTRSTVNMTAEYQISIAAMGGAGSLFAAIVKQKGQVYDVCQLGWRRNGKGMTFRAFLMPCIITMLKSGDSYGEVPTEEGGGITTPIENPWKVQSPAVSVPANILDKFADPLSNI